MATLHMQLDFPVPKGPLGPSNSTTCPRTAPRGPQKSHNLCTLAVDSPKPKTECILGYMAQSAILSAPNPPATTHFCWFTPLKIALTVPYMPQILATVKNGPFRPGIWQMTLMGSKWGHFTCLGTPNGLGSFFGKAYFSPIFDPFLVSKQPIFKAFWDFRRAKTGHHELKTRQKQLFWHSMWSGVIFEKSHFFFALAGPR